MGPSVNLNPVAIRSTGASGSMRSAKLALTATWVMDFVSVGRLSDALADRLHVPRAEPPVARRDLLEHDPDVAPAEAGDFRYRARDLLRDRGLFALGVAGNRLPDDPDVNERHVHPPALKFSQPTHETRLACQRAI